MVRGEKKRFFEKCFKEIGYKKLCWFISRNTNCSVRHKKLISSGSVNKKTCDIRDGLKRKQNGNEKEREKLREREREGKR